MCVLCMRDVLMAIGDRYEYDKNDMKWYTTPPNSHNLFCLSFHFTMYFISFI